MEYLIQYFSSIASNPSQAGLMFALTIGVAICMLAAALMYVVVGMKDPVRRRLDTITGSRRTDSPKSSQAIIDAVSPLIVPKKEEERTKYDTKLIQAGFRSENAMTTYYASKVLLVVLLATAVLLIAPFFPKFTTQQVIYATIIASAVGIFFPNYYLDYKLEQRKKQILNAFPDALDLLVTCTEAGLGFNGALQRVAKEMAISSPVLAEELGLVNAEIRAGIDRVSALRGLSNRTGLDEIRGLVSMLCQSIRFGTSIGETLRIYSEEFRDKRMQKAEELAAKVGTKMIFPMVFCMFPSFFLVAIGPALLGVMKVFSNL